MKLFNLYTFLYWQVTACTPYDILICFYTINSWKDTACLNFMSMEMDFTGKWFGIKNCGISCDVNNSISQNFKCNGLIIENFQLSVICGQCRFTLISDNECWKPIRNKFPQNYELVMQWCNLTFWALAQLG